MMILECNVDRKDVGFNNVVARNKKNIYALFFQCIYASVKRDLNEWMNI